MAVIVPSTNWPQLQAAPAVPHRCAALLATHGLTTLESTHLRQFVSAAASDANLKATLAHSMGALALSFSAGFEARCDGLNNGTVAPLRSFNSSEASLIQLLTSAVSVHTGLINHMSHTLPRAADPLAAELLKLWESRPTAPPRRLWNATKAASASKQDRYNMR